MKGGDMSECHQCRRPLPEGVKFCSSCGTPQHEQAVAVSNASFPASSTLSGVIPKGKGLAKAITTITSPKQKFKYVLTGIVLSSIGFFLANIPLGTATLVVGRILLKNNIKGWGYLFCIIGTAWAIGLPVLNLLSLIKTSSISIIPSLPKF